MARGNDEQVQPHHNVPTKLKKTFKQRSKCLISRLNHPTRHTQRYALAVDSDSHLSPDFSVNADDLIKSLPNRISPPPKMCRRYLLHYSGEDCGPRHPGCVPEMRIREWCAHPGTPRCADTRDRGRLLVAAPAPCPNHILRTEGGRLDLRFWLRRWRHLLRREKRVVWLRRKGPGQSPLFYRTRIRKIRLLHRRVQDRFMVFERAVMTEIRKRHAEITARY